MAQSTRAKPRRRPEVRLQQAGKENVVLNPQTSAVYRLNDTAMAIWQLCDGETLPEEMIAVVCELSKLHQVVVSEDINRILRDFDRSGLLTWVD